MEQDAVWYLFSTWSVATHHARVCGGSERSGPEVIANDFLVAGFGSTDKEVNNSLEGHERAFLEKCRLWNLKLNGAKVKQHQLSVKFTGNQLTSRPKAQLSILIFRPNCSGLNRRTALRWSDSWGWWPILRSLCLIFQRWQQSHSDA